MSKNIVEIHNLSHRYSRYGEWAIKDINLNIKHNQILGLLGSNGAGKSTTMNILCGVLNQSKGTVSINGIDLQKHPEKAKMHIGFLPQSPPIYPELTVEEYLAYCASLRLLPKKQIKDAINRVCITCGLNDHRKRVLQNLSGGYRQRVGIAKAIIHEPKLVVLDEPTNGLDPNQTLEVRKLILDIAKDRAVILSTHLLTEVNALCDSIQMIELGNLVFSGTKEEFNSYVAPNTLQVSFHNAPSLEELEKIEGIEKVEYLGNKNYRLSHNNQEINLSEKIIELSVKHAWRLYAINEDRLSLDLIFRHLSEKAAKEYTRN